MDMLMLIHTIHSLRVVIDTLTALPEEMVMVMMVVIIALLVVVMDTTLISLVVDVIVIKVHLMVVMAPR